MARSNGMATLVLLTLLAAAGFTIGVLSGIFWEEPRLVVAYLRGDTTVIAWDDESGPPDPPVQGPLAPEAGPPPVAAEPPAGRTPASAAAPRAAAPPEPRPDSSRGRFAIQVGAFATSESAEQLALRLKNGGYPAYVTPGARVADARWRVRVGPYEDRDQAERTATRLKRNEKLPTWVLDEDAG